MNELHSWLSTQQFLSGLNLRSFLEEMLLFCLIVCVILILFVPFSLFVQCQHLIQLQEANKQILTILWQKLQDEQKPRKSWNYWQCLTVLSTHFLIEKISREYLYGCLWEIMTLVVCNWLHSFFLRRKRQDTWPNCPSLNICHGGYYTKHKDVIWIFFFSIPKKGVFSSVARLLTGIEVVFWNII